MQILQPTKITIIISVTVSSISNTLRKMHLSILQTDWVFYDITADL